MDHTEGAARVAQGVEACGIVLASELSEMGGTPVYVGGLELTAAEEISGWITVKVDPVPTPPASRERGQSSSRDESAQQWYSAGAESPGTVMKMKKHVDEEISGANLPAVLIREEREFSFVLW